METAVVAAGFGDGVKLALSLLDLYAGRGLDAGVISRVDHFFADVDQLAAHREIMDGATVIDGVDDGGGLGGETRQILRNGHAAEVLLAQKGLERDRGGEFSGADQLAGSLIDAAMNFFRE